MKGRSRPRPTGLSHPWVPDRKEVRHRRPLPGPVWHPLVSDVSEGTLHRTTTPQSPLGPSRDRDPTRGVRSHIHTGRETGYGKVTGVEDGLV